MPLGAEDRLLSWLRRRLAKDGYRRLGDDAAILPSGGPWTVTQDHQIAGVHFPPGLEAARVAKRLLAVNLSDLAAMGAEPVYAFLALSCPKDFDKRRFLSALLSACRRHGVELAGGDLARCDAVAAVLTVVGRRRERGHFLRRNAARSGDRLWLGGGTGLAALGQILVQQGASWRGRHVELPGTFKPGTTAFRLGVRAVRRHLAPRPQLELSRWLAMRRRAAAIDISDGLSLDLHRLCRESDVGADLMIENLPVEGGFEEACQLIGTEPRKLILGGGEDYVLLFAVPPAVKPPPALCCHAVGRIVTRRRVRLIDSEGARALDAAGWDHFADRRGAIPS